MPAPCRDYDRLADCVEKTLAVWMFDASFKQVQITAVSITQVVPGSLLNAQGSLVLSSTKNDALHDVQQAIKRRYGVHAIGPARLLKGLPVQM